MRTLLLFVAVSGVGCGGLDPQFAGVWTGTLVVTITPSGYQPVINTNNMSHFVVEDTPSGMVVATCADSSGRLTFTGSGGRGTWEGLQSCPAPVDGCSTASVVFRNGVARLDAGPRLVATVNGTVSICGDTAPLTYEFNGTK